MNKETQKMPGQQGSHSKKTGKLGAVIFATLLAIGGGGWLMSQGLSPTTDNLTTKEISKRQEAFDKAVKAQITLKEVQPAELFKAYSAMKLQPGAIKQLEADIQHGKTKLAWITVWDDRYEDGDIINIQAGGFSSQVSLLNAKQTTAIPINQGDVTITGVADGGGGITLGFLTSKGTLSLPVIAPGQTIIIPAAK